MRRDLRIKRLAEHLKQEHYRSPIAEYIREVVYGGVDGIVTTFAVVAGFSGAALSSDTTTQLSFLVVLLFGLANLFADGVSMGLGNFLSVLSDRDYYRMAEGKELDEIRKNPEDEYQETITLMVQKGFSEVDARKLADIYRTNETYWVDFMMTHELKMTNPDGENPFFTGLVTFIAFLAFGIIPLLPFMILGSIDSRSAFAYSIVGTFSALLLLGLVKWRVIGDNFWKSVFEVLFVGGVAASVAFLVGSFFSI